MTVEAQYYSPHPWSGAVKCKPGNQIKPEACDYHAEHYWCGTCGGFYGVPHDNGMHDGPSAHPMRDPSKCVCRVCIDAATPRRTRPEHRLPHPLRSHQR